MSPELHGERNKGERVSARRPPPAGSPPLAGSPAFSSKYWLCVLALAWAGAGSSQAASVTLEDVGRAMGNARTVFTHFVQERHLSLFKEPLRSEGYLCFEQPGRVRWETTEPYRSILVSDGSGVAQFEWVDEQWKKLDMGLAGAMQNVVSQIAGVMKGQYASGGREYSARITESPPLAGSTSFSSGREHGPVVTLEPRNEKVRKMMKAIEVHLAPDLKSTTRVILRETTGDFTDIQFDQQVVNLPFQAGTFDRKSPLQLEAIRKVASKEEK